MIYQFLAAPMELEISRTAVRHVTTRTTLRPVRFIDH